MWVRKATILAAGLLVAVTVLVGTNVKPPVEAHDNWSKDNLDLMARVISAEAQGEPYEGQVAVGAVILNRTDHPEFPPSVAGVVFEPYAFESVMIGTIWQNPVPSAWAAAQDAINGWDPSYGSIFFFNPAKTSNAFIWSRQQVLTIGRHLFAR